MKPYPLIAVMLLSAGSVHAKVPTGDDYLTPNFNTGQTYSNVFSILRSIKTDGYDEYAHRNGGSADYTLLSTNAHAWQLGSNWRYDGQPAGHGASELRDGGRTYCPVDSHAKNACQPYLEGSGLVYNPTLWGVAPKQLTEGMHWKVDLKQAWELGGKNGTETVTVISVDPLTSTATLMREGTGEGFFSESDASTIQLSHNGQTESFDLTPGASHWKGYTTFIKGIVFSDELQVTRNDVLRNKDGKTVSATERRIMLLNAAPFPTL
ncbi:MAG: hypothetical protein WA777_17115 [Rhodanobacter sp.]